MPNANQSISLPPWLAVVAVVALAEAAHRAIAVYQFCRLVGLAP